MTLRPKRRTTLVQTFGEGSLSASVAPYPPPPDADVLPREGDVVGDQYRLVEKLGEGMFGRVYVAERLDVPEHRVALKVVLADLYAGRNVQRELVMLAAASHPHIVQMKDHGQGPGYVWLTMPLFEGRTLEKRLEQGPLGLREAYDVFLPICRGVQALHARGLRHQDIKPENIFLATFEGQVHPVLLDLGVAVERHATFVAGTALYGAPEQLIALGGMQGRGPGPGLSEKMDTYALAATLLRSLVGPTYFHGERAVSPFDIAEAFRLRAEDPLPRGSRDGLSGPARDKLAASLSRWLARDAEERPSAAVMARQLDVLLEPEREAAAAIERTLGRERQAYRRMRLALGGLVVLTAIGGLVGFWHRKTLRLASALQHAEAQGRASFSQLDTCVAAHRLAEDDAASCAAGRDADQKAHTAAIDKLHATSAATEEAFAGRLATVNTRLRTCRSDAKTASEAFQTERELLVSERTSVEEKLSRAKERFATTRRKLEGERDGLQKDNKSLVAERDIVVEERDAARRAHVAAEAEVGRLTTLRDQLQASIATLEKEKAAQRCAPPPSAPKTDGPAARPEAPPPDPEAPTGGPPASPSSAG